MGSLVQFYPRLLYNIYMAYTFGNINVAAKKHVLNLQVKDSCVLLDKSEGYSKIDSPIIVLTDEYYNAFQVRAISLFLESNRITRYKILSALNCPITKDQIKEDQKSGLVDFYRNNSFDFWKEIPAGAVIIPSGAALYSITRADDLYSSHVFQRIFGKSHFWFSRTGNSQGNWIFPIESFRDLFASGFNSQAVDSFKTKLAMFQFKEILSKKCWYSPRYPQLKKIFISSKEEFVSEFYEKNKHRRGDLLAWDLETSGFSFLNDRIGCFTASFDGITGYYIPWNLVDISLLNEILGNNVQLGANLKFDIKFLKREGVTKARVDEDVIALGHVLDETRSNSLKSLAYFYTEYGGYDYALDEYKRKTRVDNYLEIPEDLLREYAIMDAIVTWRVFKNMYTHLKQLDEKYPNEWNTGWNLERYYRERVIPSTNMYAKIEYTGTYVDMAKLSDVREKVTERLKEVRVELADKLGVSKHFDFDSPAKLGKLFYDRGWEEYGLNKKGEYQCADYQLERWARTHPEVKLIQEMRTLNVFLKTFIGDEAGEKGWMKHIVYHPEDNSYRMHASYNAMGTESGRTRCSNPNMMNIPTRGKFAKEIKKCIVPPNPDDYYLMTIDYSALQMRLAALDSDDPELCSLFLTKGKKADVHCKTAYGVFVKGKKFPIDQITVEQDGKQYFFLGGEQVLTERGEIFARDLKETDTLIR